MPVRSRRLRRGYPVSPTSTRYSATLEREAAVAVTVQVGRGTRIESHLLRLIIASAQPGRPVVPPAPASRHPAYSGWPAAGSRKAETTARSGLWDRLPVGPRPRSPRRDCPWFQPGACERLADPTTRSSTGAERPYWMLATYISSASTILAPRRSHVVSTWAQADTQFARASAFGALGARGCSDLDRLAGAL